MDLLTGAPAAKKKSAPKVKKRNSITDIKKEKKGKKRSVGQVKRNKSSAGVRTAAALQDIPPFLNPINWYDMIEGTRMYWAVASGNIAAVEDLVMNNALVNNAGFRNGTITPLQRAIEDKKEDIVGLLLQVGAKVNFPIARGIDLPGITQKYLQKKEKELENQFNSYGSATESIKASFFFFTSLPERCCSLTNVTTLNISYNNLIEVPEAVTKLINLVSLEISHNMLETIPKSINQLKDLKKLDCSFNFLSKFPKIEDLNQLTVLNLSNNQIPTISRAIAELFRLLKCNLSNNLIGKIPKFLSDCSGLEYFNVSHNQISSLQGFQFHLFNSLRYLNISYNNITILPYRSLFTTKIPSKLIFHNNPFSKSDLRILEVFYYDLKVLTLSGLGLHELPETLGFLTQLEVLDLSVNQLTMLPSTLAQLTKLKHLDLSYNNFEVLPLFFHRFKDLQTLNLAGTIDFITHPPKAILDKGLEGIAAHFNDLLNGKPCYRTKLMVVGQENVGKSTLLHAMRQEGKKQKVRRSNMSTDGIDIAEWTMKTSEKISLKFSAWDFAGQEIYYATHSFFLSSKAIYLIVWDLRFPVENARVQFWLNSVESKASNAPVILVGTHVDDIMFQENPDRIREVLEGVATKFKKHTNIKSIISVSGTEHNAIAQLMDIINTTALNLPNIMDILPRIYEKLEKLVLSEKEIRNPPAVHWHEFQHSIASKVNFKDEEHLIEAVEFLNNLGSLILFGDKGNIQESLVILDPQWLTSMFASIITTSHSYTQKGMLMKSVLPQIWRPPRYPINLHATLIKLLQDFEIIFEMPAAHGTSNQDIMYLIPSLLTEEKPSFDILWPRYASDPSTEYNRSYVLEFVPNGLFSKLMVRFLHFIDTPLKYWRYGVIGQREKAKGIVYLEGNRLDVATRGTGASEFLRIITEIVDTLVVDWFKVRVNKTFIQCPHCLEKHNSSPFQFDLEDCEHAAAIGNVRSIHCTAGDGEPFPIRLDRIVPDISMADFDGVIVDYKDIVIEKTLGKGSFGVIYRGTWKGEVVAVKQLKVEEDMALEAFAEFRKEVWLMSGLDHPCIVNLLGYSTSPLVMVMECVTGGDLYALVHNFDIDIDWHVRMKISLDMAYGMKFLHNINPPLLHRDLKSPNVLVMKFQDGAKVIAKVADFGLSSRLFVDKLQDRAVENPTWLAPECMTGAVYTEKADVYPFAIMMWELLTREHPYDAYKFKFQMEDDVIKGVRPEIPPDCWPAYEDLMVRCWDPEPSLRPDFTEILDTLIKIVKTEIGFSNFRYALDPRADNQRNRSGTVTAAVLDLDKDLLDIPVVTVKGQILKVIETDITLNAITCTKDQVWCGTDDGFIIVFSAFSGLFLTTYVSQRGCVRCLLLVDEKHVWSGGVDSLGIWRTEDTSIFKEKSFEIVIRTGRLTLHSAVPSSKLKFKKGTPQNISIRRDGTIHYAATPEELASNPVRLKLKGASVEVVKKQLKKIILVTEDAILSLQAATEVEMNVWVAALKKMISLFSSYPSNLEMLKKLAIGKAHIMSMEKGKHTLVGLSAARELKTVDPMLRSKSPVSFAESIPSNVPVHRVVNTLSAMWIAAGNVILKVQARTLQVQKILQEVHKDTITDCIIVKSCSELWSVGGREICIWNSKNGKFIQKIECNEQISCMMQVGDCVWVGGDPTIFTFHIETKEPKDSLGGHKTAVKGMILVSDSRVWSFSEGGQICVWH